MALELVGLIGIVVAAILSVKIIYQYEKGILFMLGKYQSTLGPGLNFVIPILQELRKVDMRIQTQDIPKQEVITKDNIPVLANTVVYFKVEKAEDAILKIENYQFAVAQYTQAALRDVIGNAELDFVLTEREKIAQNIKKIVDAETSEWGIDIASIKIQEIELPAEMKRAMAKQAEAEREKRANIIVSEGELSASTNLKRAADNLAQSSGALHLRTLQTIRDIAADPSEKIIIIVPSDFQNVVSGLLGKGKKG